MVQKLQKVEKYAECPNCNNIGEVAIKKTKTKAGMTFFDLIIALFLFLILVFPGIIWVIYCIGIRKKTIKQKVCPKCGFENIIPISNSEYSARQ